MIYINDFPNCTKLDTFLFADDTTALKTGPNLTDLVNCVNNELKNMFDWFCANKMALNLTKTKYIVFHNKGKKIDLNGLDLLLDENHDPNNSDPSKIYTLE